MMTLLVPLLGSIGIWLSGRVSPNLRETVTLVTAIALFAAVTRVLVGFNAGEVIGVELIELFPGLGLAFHTEPLSILFAMIASGLWIVTSIYAAGYMRGTQEPNQTRFYVCFAVALFGAMGVAFSANLLTLFIFYEVLTISTYPLVTHKGDAKAKSAGRVYFGILMTTSMVFLLPAIVWTYVAAGTLDFVPGGVLADTVTTGVGSILLMLYLFGIAKAAMMPMHKWLPAAMVAPTPVSALLHAVAVVKAGVFTVLKVIVYIFGLETLTAGNLAEWLQWVAAFTLIAASVIALMQTNLKARLAYSTVSQLSYIVLGAALANAWAVTGAGMHIAMHAFGKITLFFCAGALYVAAKKTEIPDLDGIGRRMPVTMLAFFVG